MSPRQQPTSRRHANEGNADSAVEHQAPLTITARQISPANQQHKSNDFFTREQRWRTAFESSAIGIAMADLDGHYLAANTVFQKMVGYTETEPQEFSFLDITYEEDRDAKLKSVRSIWPGTSRRGNNRNPSLPRSEELSDHCANGGWEYGIRCARIPNPHAATSISIG
jgi:PAS domain-containing protein